MSDGGSTALIRAKTLAIGHGQPADRSVWRELAGVFRGPPVAIGLFIVVAAVGLTLAAPLLAPADPVKVELSQRFDPPGAAHLMGTDEFGRDILSRVLFGGRVSLFVAAVAVAILAIGGGVLGLTAGYFGGSYDAIVGRVLDVIFGFPTLLLALAIVAIRGPSLSSAMLAIGLHGIPGFARLCRATVLAQREREYVEAARAIGASQARIIALHILPNAIGPLFVAITLSCGYALLDEAALSFLGLGAQPPDPSWGGMLNDSQSYLADAPWYALSPGITIFLTVLGFNLLGDGLRDALDPRLRRRR